METFSALLTLCAGNSPVTGTKASDAEFDIFFDQRLSKQLSNNRDAGDLRRHRAHHDGTVMV